MQDLFEEVQATYGAPIPDYIATAFQLVDRAKFLPPLLREDAYSSRPLALPDGTYHQSAPSLYVRVLEALCLSNFVGKPIRFLHIGSGTGYLTTLVMATTGGKGTYHGIEIINEVAAFSRAALDVYVRQHFRPPFPDTTVVTGNVFQLDKTQAGKYDRIYVSAQISDHYVPFFSSLLDEDGGVMVVPANDTLLAISNCGGTLTTAKCCAVKFRNLEGPAPSSSPGSPIKLPPSSPKTPHKQQDIGQKESIPSPVDASKLQFDLTQTRARANKLEEMYETKCASTSAEIKQLQEQVCTLNKEVDEVRDVRKELASARTKVTLLQTTVDSERKRTTELVDENSQLKGGTESLKKELTTSKAQVALLQTTVDSERKRNTELVDENSHTKRELTSERAKVTTLETTINDLKANKQTLLNEIASLQQQIAHKPIPSPLTFVPRVVGSGSNDSGYSWDANRRCLLDPHSAEYLFVKDLFIRGRATPRNFEITKIEISGTINPHTMYVAKRRQLMDQRKKGLKCETLTAAADLGMKLSALDRLAPHYHRCDAGVKELLMWVGCPTDAIQSILDDGLTPVGATDSGFFGGGVYTALQAEYACRYALSEFSLHRPPLGKGVESAIVLCWVVVGNVYPITRGADYESATHGNSQFFLEGKGSMAIKPGFTAHHAAVSQAWGFQVPVDVHLAEYDEVVVAEGSQVMPQYVVTFKET